MQRDSTQSSSNRTNNFMRSFIDNQGKRFVILQHDEPLDPPLFYLAPEGSPVKIIFLGTEIELQAHIASNLPNISWE